MHFMYLNTKSQLIKRILDLEKEKEEIRRTSSLIHEAYKSAFKSYKSARGQVQVRNDEIRYLQQQLEHEKDAANGYKKAYNKLKEKQTEPITFKINQINADVWKMIKAKTFPEETHKCTKECFRQHVLPAVQRDYDNMNPKYKENNDYVSRFLAHWNDRLNDTYNFVDNLFLFQGHIIVDFKR